MNMTSEMTPTIESVSNFNELQEDLKTQLSNLQKTENKRITCRIIELSTQHKNSTYISGKIFDVQTNKTMEFSIYENLSYELYLGHTYDFEGVLSFLLRTANNQLCGGVSFNIRKIVRVYDTTSKNSQFYNDSNTNQIISLLNDNEQKKLNIEEILWRKLQTDRKEASFRVNVICGENNVVFKDLTKVCNHKAFSFEPVHVKIDNKFEIANTIKNMDKGDCDLIAVIRGGGDLSVFNEYDIVKAIVNCEKPIVTALGHSLDVTWSDKAADMYHFTPTALGRYFLDIFLQKKKNISINELNNKMSDLNQNVLSSVNQNMKNIITAFEGKTERIISHFENRMIRKAHLKFEIIKAAFWVVAGIAITLNFLK